MSIVELRSLDDSRIEPSPTQIAQFVCAWTFDAQNRRLRVNGAVAALGLDLAAEDDALADLVSAAAPEDRLALVSRLTRPEPGRAIAFRLRAEASGMVSLWRGAWDREGRSASGVALALDAGEADDGRDALTGLLNRVGFLDRLARRLEAGRPAQVLVADVRRFSRLNAALGLERADLVLAALGGRLAGAYPPECAAARIGEDEFAVILAPDAPDAAMALRGALERPLRVAGCDILPSFAIGVAMASPGGASTASEILRLAGLALRPDDEQDAESPGPREHGVRRLALEADLRGALGRGEIEAFYQPIVTLADGRVAGFEALARWRHPVRGLLPPDDFLPLMGEAGLVSGLGRRMVRTAAAELAKWRAQGRGDLFVSVNLTCAELERPGFAAEVAAVIAEAGLPAGALKLEITEGEVMRDPERAAGVLRDLRDAGAAIAVDDFGMGFSSLSYLARLPVSVLKIDRYFVRAMAANAGAATIIRSVVALGHDLGLDIVAEGVESAQAAEALRALGCRYGQGFIFAPPLPVDEALAHLAAEPPATAA